MLLTVPRALSRIHRITKFTLKRGGYHKGKQKTDTRQKVINMGCCSGVVTQAYGQPDNPVLSRGKDSHAILTAAPFRGLPQPEAHGRRNLTTSLLREKHLLRALSCCVPVFLPLQARWYTGVLTQPVRNLVW